MRLSNMVVNLYFARFRQSVQSVSGVAKSDKKKQQPSLIQGHVKPLDLRVLNPDFLLSSAL